MRMTAQLKEGTIKENDEDSANKLLARVLLPGTAIILDAYATCIEERRLQ